MARCVSFARSQEHTAAWAQCVRRARPGDLFCTVHRDAINGVMMGILHHTEPYHVTKEQIEKARVKTGALAFENALAALNVPTGLGIRTRRAWMRKTQTRRRKKSEAERAGSDGCTGGQETATAPTVAEACADGGSAA